MENSLLVFYFLLEINHLYFASVLERERGDFYFILFFLVVLGIKCCTFSLHCTIWSMPQSEREILNEYIDSATQLHVLGRQLCGFFYLVFIIWRHFKTQVLYQHKILYCLTQ
jgi:hypothetical protein